MSHGFDHEKLCVYKTALDLISWLEDMWQRIPTERLSAEAGRFERD